MNIREAILHVADGIERDPWMYNFYRTNVPPCGSPGCVVGLVAAARGVPAGESVYDDEVGIKALGALYSEWFDRMLELEREVRARDWTAEHEDCVRLLRHYADKYHPAHDPIPASVRAIFDMTQDEILAEFQRA